MMNNQRENVVSHNRKKGKSMNAWATRTCLGSLFLLSLGLCIHGTEPPKNPSSPARATQSQRRSLPFTVTIIDVTKDKYPGYIWHGGVCMDFSPGLVNIGSELWSINKNGDGPRVIRWKGSNAEDLSKQSDGSATFPPGTVRRPYMFGGMWYDAAEGKLYAPMHCEYNQNDLYGFTRQIHLATSADKGLTWQYVGPIMTRYDAGGTITDDVCGRGR